MAQQRQQARFGIGTAATEAPATGYREATLTAVLLVFCFGTLACTFGAGNELPPDDPAGETDAHGSGDDVGGAIDSGAVDCALGQDGVVEPRPEDVDSGACTSPCPEPWADWSCVRHGGYPSPPGAAVACVDGCEEVLFVCPEGTRCAAALDGTPTCVPFDDQDVHGASD